MKIADIDAAGPDALAPVLHASLKRLGELGREGAVALKRLVDDGDADFEEAAARIADIADGKVDD